jgi:hypothetical protein
VDELYRISTQTGRATDLGSSGVRGIAGSAVVNGNLELFQYHWDNTPNYIFSAPVGTTDFTQQALLSTKIVDGGVAIPAAFPNALVSGATAASPEPGTAVQFMLGCCLGLWAFHSRLR